MKFLLNTIVKLAYFLETSSNYTNFKFFINSFLNDHTSKRKIFFDVVMMILVVVSIFALIHDVKNPDSLYTKYIELIAVAFFITEYLARVWCSSDLRKIVIEHNEKTEFLNTNISLKSLLKEIFKNKLSFILKPTSIIDLLAILPSYRPLRILRIFLLFRLFKLFRYTKSLNTFVSVLAQKKFELYILMIFIGFIVFASGTAIYIYETDTNPKISDMFDAIYWSLVTISTVGYGDITAVTTEGRVITMVLIITGIGVISFATSIIVSAFSEKIEELKANKVLTEVARMDDFIVICGYGRVGEVIAKQLKNDDENFIVIEKDPLKVEEAKKDGIIAITGSGTDTDLLVSIGGEKKVSKLVCAAGNDAENIFITLTARSISKDILIIARTDNIKSKKKFILAGANHVLSPFEIVGLMASETIGQPVAFEAINGMLTGDDEILIEPVKIHHHSVLNNKTLEEINIKQYKLLLFGVLRIYEEHQEGFQFLDIDKKRFYFNPKKHFKLKADDIIIVLGHKKGMYLFKDHMESLL
ncbi:MAG: NAD-binding protein [Campylobacterales bacterium]|nr:NAD-binding protein [Campylobacterales bacterium]